MRPRDLPPRARLGLEQPGNGDGLDAVARPRAGGRQRQVGERQLGAPELQVDRGDAARRRLAATACGIQREAGGRQRATQLVAGARDQLGAAPPTPFEVDGQPGHEQRDQPTGDRHAATPSTRR
ncbi:MAG: hypothetical protein E6G41_14765 [Actinobacteria bacterium]|nr:MAG: hypothetical protein E6G41_14765 [Actinomycetota bacterium]